MYEPKVFDTNKDRNNFSDQPQTRLNISVESQTLGKIVSFTFISSTSTPISGVVANLSVKQPIKNNLISQNDDDKFDHILFLERLLKTGKIQLFLTEVDKIDWTKQPPKHFILAIKLSLEVEAISLAQKLSVQGAKLYPENIELQKFARILQKPILESKNQHSDINLQANSKWIMENRQKYKGQWVALKNGLLLETSESLKLLTSKFTERKNIYFTKVY